MVTQRRLDRVQAELTAIERVRAVLQAHQAGQTPDPRLQFWPYPDRAEEYELGAVVDAMDLHGRALALYFDRAIRCVELLVLWRITVSLCRDLARPALNFCAGPADDPDPARAFAHSQLQCLDNFSRADGEAPSIAATLDTAIADAAQTVSEEVRAVERVIEQFAGVLECDPLLPDVRGQLDAVRDRLQALTEPGGLDAPVIALAEADADNLRWARQLFGLTDPHDSTRNPRGTMA